MEGHKFISGQATRLGRVVCVSGSQVVVLLEAAGPADTAAAPSRVQMGELVKIHHEKSVIFGVVRAMSVPMPEQDAAVSEVRMVELELLGEAMHPTTGLPTNGLPGASDSSGGAKSGGAKSGGEEQADAAASRRFKRGVTLFPALGDTVEAADAEDLALVYSAQAGAAAVRIGRIFQDRSLPAYVFPDRLLGRHFAMLGTTGTGKSCAAALILQAILKDHANAHILLLDPHNEYARAFGEEAVVLAPGSLQLPYWLFNFEEIVQVVFGDDSEDADTEQEITILRDLIPKAKRHFLGDSDLKKHVTVDSPIPYSISEVTNLIDDAMGRLDRPDGGSPYARLKARITTLKTDSRYDFLFGGIAVRDNMTKILSGLFRVPVDGKPITIIDLSGIPSEVLNVVVSVICRMTFDFALWSEQKVPLLLVCEEAHRYAPQDTKLGFEPTKRALSRLAKEGRKYGVSLGLITQRPAELAPGILSQCNTIFALRMTNQNDCDFLRAALPDSAAGLLEFLPSLGVGEAIAIGEGVPVPVRLCFDRLPDDRRPLSDTAHFSDSWRSESPDQAFLSVVVDRWRRQRR